MTRVLHTLTVARATLAFALTCGLAACATPVATEPIPTVAAPTLPAPTLSAPTAPATAQPSAAFTNDQQAIQATVNRYVRSFEDNDRELFFSTVDEANRPFRRFMQGQFDGYQESFMAGGTFSKHTVTNVETYKLGLVLATVEVNNDYEVLWVFRSINGRWVLSEPTPKELGKPQKVEREHFTFMVYPWADEWNDSIMELMESARTTATERLGATPTEKPVVNIRPSYSVAPNQSTGFLAQYRVGTPDHIDVYSPTNQNFGFYNKAEGWQAPLERTLVHEYTHLVHKRSFDNAGSFSHWMQEGLAEYISDNPRADEVAFAVQNDALIPIMDDAAPITNKQDLMHMTGLNADQSLAYGEACSLVTYITEEYGGLDGFWKFARTYDESQDLKKAISETFGISYEQFDADWRAWLEETYG